MSTHLSTRDKSSIKTIDSKGKELLKKMKDFNKIFDQSDSVTG